MPYKYLLSLLEGIKARFQMKQFCNNYYIKGFLFLLFYYKQENEQVLKFSKSTELSSQSTVELPLL